MFVKLTRHFFFQKNLELRHLSFFKLLNHSAEMRPSKFIRFYLCFAFVFKTVLSTKTNVTGSDGKVFISGDRNEVHLCLLRERRKLISLTRAHRKESQ